MNIFSIFGMPSKISALVSAVNSLIGSGKMSVVAAADTAFASFLSDVKADVAELEADVMAFRHDGIFQWGNDLKKLCTDAATIGVQVVSLYEGLQVDPAIAGALGTVIAIVNDISGLLAIVGIKLPIPKLSPAATRAVEVATPSSSESAASQPATPTEPAATDDSTSDSGTVDGDSLDTSPPTGLG